MTGAPAAGGLRVFFATGEASGDFMAAALAAAMRAQASGLRFAGIGSERMAAAGIELTTRTTGWGSLGPLGALRRIPPLFFNAWRHALWLRGAPWDLIVLIDFGAYNLRLAKTLRGLGYRKPILYFMPPGAWLDRARQACAVARYTTPLTAFEHQRDFYASLGLHAAYFGHPLLSLVEPRPTRPLAPGDGGVVALLPGSRRAELARHVPVLLEACRVLRARRPRVEFLVAAADGEAQATLQVACERAALRGLRVVRGARAALDPADAAWIASGTAVLEASLREVPAVALYIIAESQVALARRVWPHPYVTLPNILAGREIVPERLQADATPARLADALAALLDDPARSLRDMRALRASLGAPDALARCAAFALELARA